MARRRIATIMANDRLHKLHSQGVAPAGGWTQNFITTKVVTVSWMKTQGYLVSTRYVQVQQCVFMDDAFGTQMNTDYIDESILDG